MDITKDYLTAVFTYDNGQLIWNRDRSLYDNEADYKRYLTRSHGKVAGSIKKTYSQYELEYWVICLKVGLQRKRSRLVWIYHNGAIPNGLEIDHINRDSLDDRIENLRLVTPKENKANRKAYKNNNTGITGIAEKEGVFTVSIRKEFDSIEKAEEYKNAIDSIDVPHET